LVISGVDMSNGSIVRWLFAAAAFGAIASTCFAQSQTTEEMRENLRAQIRASQEAQANSQDGDQTDRSIRVNNHQDTNQLLYGKPTPPPGYASRPPASTPVNGGSKALNLTLPFEYNSDRLSPEAYPELRRFAAALDTPDLRGLGYLVAGHTDSSGADSYNLTLSRRRAAAVVDALAVLGIDTKKIRATGLGESRPILGLSSADPRNRRVEVTLLP
jgi:outer membrane protein OmpA-like peptidoglycan-associated protein